MNLRLVTFGLLAASMVLISFDAGAQVRKKKSQIDRESAKASTEVPVTAQVDKVVLEHDPNLPTFVVMVEPFDYAASGQISGGGQGTPLGSDSASGESYTQLEDGSIRTEWSSTSGSNVGNGIAKQLQTALSGWANVAVVEPDAVQKVGDGTYTCKMQPGEIGPFIIRGTITEFSETADMTGQKRGFDSRKLGVATGIIGAITGNRAATATGAGVAILGPEFKNEKMKRTGMLAMDLRVLDGRIARVTPGGAFDVRGSFTTVSGATDFSMVGVSAGNAESAASSLGQATRAAMNDALIKTRDTLSKANR